MSLRVRYSRMVKQIDDERHKVTLKKPHSNGFSGSPRGLACRE